MALPKPSDSGPAGRKSFWTPGRVVLTMAGLGLVSALGLSSCNSNDVSTTSRPEIFLDARTGGAHDGGTGPGERAGLVELQLQ